ncbi:MAG: DNA polymerase III subunit alpha, partial [Propionibacterium sp.]|nr:DNA polymerase III subunit alpha [Propionibacterium sp.]
CELITAAHATSRDAATVTLETIAQHCAGHDVVVGLGADSQAGRLLVQGRLDDATHEVARWRDELGGGVVVAATNHHTSGRGVASAHQAAGLLRVAERLRLPAVATNMVRMARREQAAIVDVLDAARRLVPLDMRNIDRANAEGYLKPEPAMRAAVDEAARLIGADPREVLDATESLAERAALDPMGDVGLGEIRLPEFEILGTTVDEAPRALRERALAGLSERYDTITPEIHDRLDDELAVIGTLGFESYFLTVGDVTDMIRRMGIRCAARGSGAGSLVNYALGISGVDPIRYGLIMERFLSPLRVALPDIDLDVESARRTEVYDKILEVFGRDRVACVAMIETYRVRHAVRDVGAALGLPPVEVDAMAKAFPHIRARDARAALRDLPELRAAGLAEQRLEVLFDLVESLDGLPRHIALHPCGVILSDSALPQRTPVEASFGGYPMSQFDKDDVEDLGLLKLDVLGIRMQSAMAHALDELERTTGTAPDIDALAPYDDEQVYDMIARRQTLGCFQIESPGQRELVGKFGPASFEDIVIDISLFRPGPVKSDMITPFIDARQGFKEPDHLHDDFRPVLDQTEGVVVFHEQVIQLVAVLTGCTLAQGDEVRRALGDRDGQEQVRGWLFPKARARGYDEALIARVWDILVSFASFGFCKAHAAAFALPTYQSAWLKRHHPAHFLAGILTHDPGMYPKRLLLEEARRLDLPILGLDVNASTGEYRAEEVGDGWGIRLSLADVKGIGDDEITRIVEAQPYESLTDFWQRADVSRPTTEHLVLAGAFDAIYDIGDAGGVQSSSRITRRDLLLTIADLHAGIRKQTPAQAAFAFEFDDATHLDIAPSGLPEMDADERLKAELEILGLDASRHIMERYLPMLRAIGATSAGTILQARNRSEVLIAGVKVATQTPPVRSGRRVIFLTLDDSTGPVDATFFEDVQGPYSATVFNSWLLLVRGVIRRTGPRGVSIRATGAWDLGQIHDAWRTTLDHTHSPDEAVAAVRALVEEVHEGYSLVGEYIPPEKEAHARIDDDATRAGGMGRRRVLVHASGYKQSPYADIKPQGTSAAEAPRKLWHSSPGSAGR